METAITAFCSKYIVLMEVLYRDKELNQWCRNYSAYRKNTTHCELEKLICDGFMQEAYALGFMPKILAWKHVYTGLESALAGTKSDLIYGIFAEIRSDYGCNGSLISHAIAEGNLYRLMRAYLSRVSSPQYTLDYITAQECRSGERSPGTCSVRHDQFMHKWHLRILLDKEQLWYSFTSRKNGIA